MPVLIKSKYSIKNIKRKEYPKYIQSSRGDTLEDCREIRESESHKKIKNKNRRK